MSEVGDEGRGLAAPHCEVRQGLKAPGHGQSRTIRAAQTHEGRGGRERQAPEALARHGGGGGGEGSIDQRRPRHRHSALGQEMVLRLGDAHRLAVGQLHAQRLDNREQRVEEVDVAQVAVAVVVDRIGQLDRVIRDSDRPGETIGPLPAVDRIAQAWTIDPGPCLAPHLAVRRQPVTGIHGREDLVGAVELGVAVGRQTLARAVRLGAAAEPFVAIRAAQRDQLAAELRHHRHRDAAGFEAGDGRRTAAGQGELLGAKPQADDADDQQAQDGHGLSCSRHSHGRRPGQRMPGPASEQSV